MIVETFPVGLLACNATIVGDETTREAIVVDGGDGVDDVLRRLKALGLRAQYLIHTHAHFDHIADVGRLRESTQATALLHHADLPIYHDQPRLAKLFGLPPLPSPVNLDGDLPDGERLTLGGVTCEVLHTP
ncbi:MAG TPA: MBL fold metallo-hydrolase, partial [Candidatus Aquilonibacter sp.]